MTKPLRTTLATALTALALCRCDGAPTDPTKAADAPRPEKTSTLSFEELRDLILDPDAFAKARKLGEMLPNLGPEGLPAVKEALSHAAVLEMGAVEFELLMRYWAQHDPEAASWYAIGTAPRGYQVAAIYGTLRPWVIADPKPALAQAAHWALMGGDVGQAVQIALVRGWYDAQHPGLEQYIQDLGVTFERQRALTAYAREVLHDKGAAELVRWAEAVPETDKDYKLDVYRRVGMALVPFDVEAAVRFCDAHCEGPFGNTLRGHIADRWARIDPRATLEWLAKGPEGWERNFAVRVTFEAWGNKDRKGARAWLEERMDGEKVPEWLNSTLPVYAPLLALDDPTRGLEWAKRLADQKEREWVTLEIAHRWHEEDQPAAEAWLEQSWLSPEQRALVRDKSKTWRSKKGRT